MTGKRRWLAFCGVFILSIVGFFIYNMLPGLGWAKTSGMVVETISSRSSGTHIDNTEAPIAEYIVNGKTYKTNPTLFSLFGPKVGQIVQVSYKPSNPEKAKVVTNKMQFMLLVPFILGGLLPLYIALFRPQNIQ